MVTRSSRYRDPADWWTTVAALRLCATVGTIAAGEGARLARDAIPRTNETYQPNDENLNFLIQFLMI